MTDPSTPEPNPTQLPSEPDPTQQPSEPNPTTGGAAGDGTGDTASGGAPEPDSDVHDEPENASGG